jgi:hypothetical protein
MTTRLQSEQIEDGLSNTVVVGEKMRNNWQSLDTGGGEQLVRMIDIASLVRLQARPLWEMSDYGSRCSKCAQ